MSRTRVALGSLVGAGVIHFALVACEPAFPTLDAAIPNDGGVLDAMRDAFVDAVGTMRDAEVREAQAQDASSNTARVFEAQCDRTIEITGGLRLYFAEVSVPGINTATPPAVMVWACGGTAARGGRELLCGGQPCTGYDLPAIPCITTNAFVSTDRIVANCGQGEAHRERVVVHVH